VTAVPEPPPLDGTAWVLSSLPGRTPLGGQPATLRFEDGRAQGSDGCNRYTVAYATRGAALDVGPRGAGTQMACAPEVMQQAEAFNAALRAAKTYRVAEGSLQLLAAGGEVLATLAPQSTTLAGTSWRVTAINDGKGAVASVRSGSTVTLEFDDKGQAGGSAGCNRFVSRYEREGTRLRFAAPAATRRMCAEEGVMEQERQFLEALQSVATIRIEGRRMELRRADGALALTLREGDG
jgi:heat shock protein HslJ